MPFFSFIISLALILSGALMLLNNLGYDAWRIIWAAARFWPVLLIMAGLKMLWGTKSPRWLDFVLTLLVITAVLVYTLFFTPVTRNI